MKGALVRDADDSDEVGGKYRLNLVPLRAENMFKVISCPIQAFIDGFGMFRNSYQSLVGVYAIPAVLNIQDRHRRANILPLTLSPHGSNFDDTIRAL